MPLKPDVIHLEVLGQACAVHVDVPVGPCRATDLLPAARALSSSLSDAAVRNAAANGRQVTCSAGCGACCRQMVGISAIEAAGVAATVQALPEPRRTAVKERFADAVRRLEAADLLDPAAPGGKRTLRGLDPAGDTATAKATSARYLALGIPCPLLEDERCSIYHDRPMMCREYNVSSPPQRCADTGLTGVEKIAPPAHVGASLGRVARELFDAPLSVMPLTLSLEWAEANRAEADKPIDGEQWYGRWVRHMGGELA